MIRRREVLDRSTVDPAPLPEPSPRPRSGWCLTCGSEHPWPVGSGGPWRPATSSLPAEVARAQREHVRAVLSGPGAEPDDEPDVMTVPWIQPGET